MRIPKMKSSLDHVLASTQSIKPKPKRSKKRAVCDERIFKEVTINNNVSKPHIETMTSKEARRLEKIHLIELARKTPNYDAIKSHR